MWGVLFYDEDKFDCCCMASELESPVDFDLKPNVRRTCVWEVAVGMYVTVLF